MGELFSSMKQFPKVNSIKQDQYSEIKQKYCLDNENIMDLYNCFLEMDRYHHLYIDFDDFVNFIKRDIQHFVELPYAERLFICIQKSRENRIYFEEFVRGISAFCLLNEQSLLQFVFDCIDEDCDGVISKKDIIKLIKYIDPQNGNEIFFTNFIINIEYFPIRQNQNTIDFDHFKINWQKLLFLIQPVFNLQNYLRNIIIGNKFWVGLYKKVQKKIIQIKKYQEKEQKIKQKLQIFKSMKQRNVQQLLFKNNINLRKCGEISDDLKLQKRLKTQRRRSQLYIKQQIPIKTGSLSGPQK